MEMSRRSFVSGAATAVASVAAATGLAKTSRAAEGAGTVESWLPEAWDYEADVVIVGYGCAGASAAIEAADNGASVVLLEKETKDEAGGDLSLNAGYSELGVRGGYNMTAEEVKVGTMGLMSDEDIQTYLTFEDRIQEIEEKIGAIQIGPDLESNPDAMLYVQNPDDPESFGNTGWYWYTLFEAAVEQRSDKVTVLYETPGFGLVQNPVTKEIAGVIAGTPETPVYVKANQGVLLCAGGFQSDPEFYEGVFSVGMYQPTCGHPANTGDAIKMGLAAGAKMTHVNLATEYMGVTFRKASEDAGTAIAMGQGVGGTNAFQSSYIIVNKEGKRFDDETKDWMHRHDYPNHWLDLEGAWFDSADQQNYVNYPAWVILDQAAIDSGALGRQRGDGGWGYNISNPNRPCQYEWSADNQKEIENGYLIKADTIEELCEKLTGTGMLGREYSPDPEGVKASIEEYNEYAAQADSAAVAQLDVEYFDGTYTSTQQGKNDPFEITVTIKDGKIASVEIGENNETPALGGAAIETLPDEIVAANGTTGVEAYAGATLTSDAIIAGVNACLAQAISGGAAGEGVAEGSIVDEFGRSNFTPMSEEGPYYGAEVVMGTIYTIGGLNTNINSQVLAWNGNPIPRLYSAGDTGTPFVLRTPATHGATATALAAVDHMLTLEPLSL